MDKAEEARLEKICSDPDFRDKVNKVVSKSIDDQFVDPARVDWLDDSTFLDSLRITKSFLEYAGIEVPAGLNALEAEALKEEGGRDSKAVKKRQKRKARPVPPEAFSNQQLSLFQDFLANTDEQRENLSNAIHIWDNAPKYSISRKSEEKLRLPGGFLPIQNVDFEYHERSWRAQIRPARLVRDGETIEHYPSAREELIEHALRKLAAEQNAGFFDEPRFASGVSFTLHMLREELKSQGHAMTYEGLVEGLEILHYSYLTLIDLGSGKAEQDKASQPFLPALVRVNRQDIKDDPQARWLVHFNPLVTDSINQIKYRQFNYQRLMQCRTQLSRWLVSQLVLKYTAASVVNHFEMSYSTIKRDSKLVNYTRERDGFDAVDDAWEELKELEAIKCVEKEVKAGARGKIADIKYTIYPSAAFAAEQRAANRRLKDALLIEENAPKTAK